MEKYNFGEDDQMLLDQNKLGIQTFEELAIAEQYVFIVRSLEIAIGKYVIQSFDFKGLQNLHHYLFGDLYEFAGKIRNVQLTKGSTRFCQAQFIGIEGDRIFREIAAEKDWPSIKIAANRLAYFKAELNMLHPFREGNGRTIRVFIHHWARSRGYYWAFEHLQQDTYLRAMIQSVVTSDELEQLFLNTLTLLE